MVAGEKDLVANIPKPKEDSALETVPGWEEFEKETLEPEDSLLPKWSCLKILLLLLR